MDRAVARARTLALQRSSVDSAATYPFVPNRQPNGTASLHGMNLPADRVAAVMDRLTEIARRRRAADEPRTMDQLRADAFLGLLEGRLPQKSHRRPMVDIRVELPTLLGLEERAGEIPGWDLRHRPPGGGAPTRR